MAIQRIPLTSGEWEYQRGLDRKKVSIFRRRGDVGDDNSEEGRKLLREERRISSESNEHISRAISARGLPLTVPWHYDPTRGCLWCEPRTTDSEIHPKED